MGGAVAAQAHHPKKANEIGAQIQKQSGPMVSFVMQFFGHAPELVRNLAHPSGAFLDEWKERLTNLGRGLWDAANREIARLNDEVAETKRVVDGTRQARTFASCSGRIVPMDWIHRDAAIARATMLRNAKEMKTNVAQLARSIADRYLARYGLTYESWMAAVGAGASPVLVAGGSALERPRARRSHAASATSAAPLNAKDGILPGGTRRRVTRATPNVAR
jgi:hypothetical protein